jgi:enamine deaminase RidA (YjgF/YER057c/UK114 family)
MGARDERLEQLGYPLDRLNPEGRIFDTVRIDGSTIYVSGHVPMDGDKLVSKGKVPSQVTVAEATKAAALCAANNLRSVRRALGSLDRVSHVVRITGYVNSDPEFIEQHLVMHGASNLVREVFGDAGRHARSALGMAQLPLGSSVEVEMILSLGEDAR